MSKTRLLKFLPVLLALLLVFTVSVFAAVAEPEDSGAESSAVSDGTETSDASSEAESSAAESAGESSVAESSEPEQASSSNIPWKLIITLAVIVVIVAVLFILAKTNSKLGQRIAKFFKDYKSEIKKISWMPRKDLVRSTLVVLAVLIVAGVAIGLLDFIFSELVKLLSSIG